MPNSRYGPIKVNIQLKVPAAARRFIALQYPQRGHTVRKHLAKRATIAEYVQARLDSLCELVPFWDDAPRSEAQQEETRLAVVELRKLGWSDRSIYGWMMLQQARLEALKVLKFKGQL